MSALAAGSFYGDTRVRYRAAGIVLSDVRHSVARSLPAHSHTDAYFSLLLSGAYEEDCGRSTLAYSRWTVGFHPAGLVHRDRLGAGGGRFFIVEVGESWLARAREVGGTEWRPMLLPSSAAWLGRRLREESAQAAVGSALAIEALVLELLVLAARARSGNSQRPAWLGRVREALAAEPGRRWTVAGLAAEVGVHPVHLARAVRRHAGCSVGDLMRETRVQAAAALLEEGMAPADVALTTGFADQSHLTRVFRQLTGSTPGAFRRARRG